MRTLPRLPEGSKFSASVLVKALVTKQTVTDFLHLVFDALDCLSLFLIKDASKPVNLFLVLSQQQDVALKGLKYLDVV